MTAPNKPAPDYPRNSASSQQPDHRALEEDSTSSNAEYTGFRARMTPSAAAMSARKYEE